MKNTYDALLSAIKESITQCENKFISPNKDLFAAVSPYNGGWCRGGDITVTNSGDIRVCLEIADGALYTHTQHFNGLHLDKINIEDAWVQLRPELKKWLDAKVLHQPWGGLYTINVSFSFNTEGFDNTGGGKAPCAIIAVDNKRKRKLVQNIETFILEKRYVTGDKNQFYPHLKNIAMIAPMLVPKLGHEAVIAMFDYIADSLLKDGREIYVNEFFTGFFQYVLNAIKHNDEYTTGHLLLLCYMGKKMYNEGKDEYDKECGLTTIQLAAANGCKEAQDILAELGGTKSF